MEDVKREDKKISPLIIDFVFSFLTSLFEKTSGTYVLGVFIMPRLTERGGIMANNENLLKGKDTQFKSGEKAARSGRNGGIASGVAKREKKLIKETLEKRLKVADLNELADNLIERAKMDNKAFELLRDTLGQKPKETIRLENDDQSIKEMEAYFDSAGYNEADKE